MIEQLRALHSNLVGLKTNLPKPRTNQVYSEAVKSQFRELVDRYFREVRSSLVRGGINDAEFADLDTSMQHMLQFTHRKVTAAKYTQKIKDAAASIVRIEQLCLTTIGVPMVKKNIQIEEPDTRIIETLTQLVPAAAASYKQAILDLQTNERLSWRGPAVDLREALRETLDHLAPDRDVEAQPGYRAEHNLSQPTMKQKVRYVLSKRGISRSASETTEHATTSIDELLGTFIRSVYTRSNISTHTATPKKEVLYVRGYVRLTLCELLEIPT